MAGGRRRGVSVLLLVLILGAIVLQLFSIGSLRPRASLPASTAAWPVLPSIIWQANESATSWPFVTVNGTRLYRFGEPYRFVGANLWYAMHLGAADTASGDRPRLLRELDRLQALGVSNIRVLAASEGPDRESWFVLGAPTPWRILPSMQPSPGAYNEAVVAGLDFLLAEMAKRDMTAVLMLGNMWPWSGGFAQYVNWVTGQPIPYMVTGEHTWDEFQSYASQFFNEPRCIRLFKEHVRYIVQRTNSLTGVAYRDDPTIMAWELANEPRAMKAVAGYRRWLNQSAVLIKSLDPHHLVTTGTEGRTPFPEAYIGTNVVRDHSYAAIDYVTAHVWAQNWEWYDPARSAATLPHALRLAKQYVRDHAQYAARLGKPLVLEEFGMSRDGNRHEAGTRTRTRDAFYASLCDEVLALA